jgi:hypothetical protein
MIHILIETPASKEPRKGIIDLEASFEEIKTGIVDALNLGSPKEYRLFHEPPASRTPGENKIQEGDLFVLVKKEKTPAFIPNK